jgi:hypothetical protein
MGHWATPRRAASLRIAATVAIGLLGTVLLLVWGSGPAAAAPLVGKDGKIHACYKFKGKAKGTIRVVRSAKVRCPRRWKKVAWYASVSAGPPGPAGEAGPRGEMWLPGTAGNIVVEGLEDKVTDLLTRVQSLEAVLAGISNEQLLKAIGAVPAVQSLCTQTKKLNEQTTKLGESTAALNTLLGALLVSFAPVEVPTALAAFSCPAF